MSPSYIKTEFYMREYLQIEVQRGGLIVRILNKYIPEHHHNKLISLRFSKYDCGTPPHTLILSCVVLPIDQQFNFHSESAEMDDEIN